MADNYRPLFLAPGEKPAPEDVRRIANTGISVDPPPSGGSQYRAHTTLVNQEGQWVSVQAYGPDESTARSRLRTALDAAYEETA